jgi:tRNA(Phe) wybutosine-synthesizing methylase Tyw3
MSLGEGKRIVLEMRSTEYLALPIMLNGKLLVNEDFLKILIRESNKRIERGWEKIKKLQGAVSVS